MTQVIILHSNDIHGRLDAISRIGSQVAELRQANPGSVVLYFDLGDSEEYDNRISSITNGIGLHRLLAAAGCDAVVVGNAIMARYGPRAVTAQALASEYPHLMANVQYADGTRVEGTSATAVIRTDEFRLGIIGLTAEMDNYTRFFDLEMIPELPLVRKMIADLRAGGAHAVVLLSHLGLQADLTLAEELSGEVPLILGAHSHDLLPDGRWVGETLVAQAGEYGQHLGQVALDWDGRSLVPVTARVIPLSDDMPRSRAVDSELALIEGEIDQFLAEEIGQLDAPLEYSIERECGLGNLLADALRERGRAQVAVAVPGPHFTGGLPSGPISRDSLWSTCPSTGSPGVVTMLGSQLAAVIAKGLDPDFAADRHPSLRGRARGLIHLSGACVRAGRVLVDGQPIASDSLYRVAGSDFEFEPVWGYVDESWQLAPQYETDRYLRDALEAYLRAHSPISVPLGRVA